MPLLSRDNFPRDDDGDVLYRLAVEGEDLSCKRDIEFYCYAKDEKTAETIAADLESYGYRSSIHVGREGTPEESVSVYSKITMLPTYDLIVLEQTRLNLILKPYGAQCDGWMTESSPKRKLQ